MKKYHVMILIAGLLLGGAEATAQVKSKKAWADTTKADSALIGPRGENVTSFMDSVRNGQLGGGASVNDSAANVAGAGVGIYKIETSDEMLFKRLMSLTTALTVRDSTDSVAFDLDADLITYAGITPSANIQTYLGAADYAAMRTQLALVIGTNVQAYDADLTTWAGITPSANVQTFCAAANYAAMRTALGVAIGSDVQAYDADLTTWAGITPSANVQSFNAAADYAAMRTALGLVIGTNVQAYDADLTTYAGITPSANVQTLLSAADYAAFKTSLSLNSVENTALSTWAGTTNITTLGTIATGVWSGTAVHANYLGNHATKHNNGGTDEIGIDGLSGQAADAQKVYARKGTGSNVGPRPKISFVEGSNISLTVVDDTLSEEIDVTIGATGLQASDADLTALAALASTGLVARTGAATYAERTLTGSANQVSISNGDGVSGNPTFTLASGIDAAKIGGGGVSTTEFDYLGTLSSNAQTQISARALHATTITINGTANEITSSAGAQDLSTNRTWTLSLPASIDLGGKTSFELPNAAAPTTDAFGEVAGDNNAWAASRGAVQFYDGTANTWLIGALSSDAPSNGQVPKWNTGGTVTWEDDATTPDETLIENIAADNQGLVMHGTDTTKGFVGGTYATFTEGTTTNPDTFDVTTLPTEIGLAASDETTDLTTGTAKITFRMPYAMTVTEVRANVNTAPVGATITVDINEGGTTILSTKLTIDASEETSTTAATPAVISDAALADDAEMTIDVDQIGSSTAGKGLKIWLIGTRSL